MTTEVRTLKSNDSIMTAAEIMDKLNVGSIPVVDNDKITGIITDRDIVIRCVAKGKGVSEKISSAMSANVTFATPDMDIHEVADIMAEQQVRRLPVVDAKDKIVGIVAIGDLAVESVFKNEAGVALHDISFGIKH